MKSPGRGDGGSRLGHGDYGSSRRPYGALNAERRLPRVPSLTLRATAPPVAQSDAPTGLPCFCEQKHATFRAAVRSASSTSLLFA